jgi:hypothetical protein
MKGLRAVGSMKITTTTVTSQYHAYSAKLPSMNTDDMRRLVGYSEYTRALSLLDPLVTRATAAELKIMDEIVGSRKEFTVYTNLSARIPKKAASSLDVPADPSDDSAKRGLAWVMALARVELGAMVAGFTGRGDPFALVPPTRFELPAYSHLLLDGARTHYFALGNDPVVSLYMTYRNKPLTVAEREGGRADINETQAIAYGRRVALAREFVRAVQSLGRGQLTSQQTAELQSWDQDLTALIEIIAYKILGLGESSGGVRSVSSTTRTIKKGDFLTNCPFLRCDTKNRIVTPTPNTGTSSTGTTGKTLPGKVTPGAGTPGKTIPGKGTPSVGKSKP